MKKNFQIICVLIFCLSRPMLLAWKKVEGFVDGPNYNNSGEEALILYTNAYQVNEINLPLLFDFRGPIPSSISLSNEVLFLQVDLFDKNDVVRTNFSYPNIPNDFLKKIADKSIFFRLGYNGNIYAIDKDSKSVLVNANPNQAFYTWTELPQNNLIAYVIIDFKSRAKEKISLNIINSNGILITNIHSLKLNSLSDSQSYWMGDSIFCPTQGRNASIPTLYCINTDTILYSETLHGMPRLLDNKIEVFLWNDEGNIQAAWSKIVVFTNNVNTAMVDKLSRINVEQVEISKLKHAGPTNTTKDRFSTAITEPTSDLIFGVTKRNLLSALMIAGGGALLVMTLLYAFWPRQK